MPKGRLARVAHIPLLIIAAPFALLVFLFTLLRPVINTKPFKVSFLILLLAPAPILALSSWLGLVSPSIFERIGKILYWPFLFSIFFVLAVMLAGMAVIISRRLRKH